MIRHYRGMLDDPVRLQAFRGAIQAAVRPGDVVVDLGCGLGTYALFACQAGAGRVYAVDAAPILEVAQQVAASNGCEARIRFVAGESTALHVPEAADVVVFEDYPTCLLSPASARVVRDIRDRWLRPGGLLVPSRGRLWIAAVEDHAGHAETDRFRWTTDRVFGLDVGLTRHLAFCEPQAARLGPAAVLTAPALARDVDLLVVGDAGLKAAARVEAQRPGAIHGLLLWFELELGDTWLSTGPDAASRAWHQVLFRLERPILVEAGAEIELELEAGPFGDEMVWRWRVAVADRAFDATNFESLNLESQGLARFDPDHVPRRDREHELEQAILELLDGARSLGEIARELSARFPGRFGRAEDAQRRVLESVRHAPERHRAPEPAPAFEPNGRLRPVR